MPSVHRAENPQPTKILLGEKTIPVTDCYSTLNAVYKAKEYVGRGASEMDIHAIEYRNLQKAILEFVFKTPSTGIEYFFDSDNRMKYGNVNQPIIDEWFSNAEAMTGKSRHQLLSLNEKEIQDERREAADAVGQMQIEAWLSGKDINTVFLISPPSFGEKGFGTHSFFLIFRKIGDTYKKVDVDLERYQETEDFSKSATKLLKLISYLRKGGIAYREAGVQNIKNERGFLINPVGAKIEDWQLRNLLDSLEFDESKQKRGRQYERLIESDLILQQLIETYLQEIMLHKDMSVIFDTKSLDDLLNAIFNRALELKEKVSTISYFELEQLHGQGSLFETDKHLFGLPIHLIVNHYNQDHARISGGSCPVSQKNNNAGTSGGILAHSSMDQIFSNVNMNQEKSGSCNQCHESLADDHYHCDKCGFKHPSARHTDNRPTHCQNPDGCDRKFGC